MSKYEPTSLDKALFVMKREKVTLCAGGTGIDKGSLTYPLLKLDLVEDLDRLYALDDCVRIGAMCRLSAVMEDCLVPMVLRRAICTVLPKQIRDTATIGGALCVGARRSIVSCVLSALGATVVCRTRTTERLIPIDSFTSLAEDALVSAVIIPLEQYTNASFERLDNTWLCAVAQISNSRVDCIRLRFGGFSERVFYSDAIESILCNKTIKAVKATAESSCREYARLLEGAKADSTAIASCSQLLADFFAKL